MTSGVGQRGIRKPWTAAEVAALVARYPHEKTEALAADIGRSVSSVNAAASKLGLKKSEAYLASPAACRLRRGDNPGVPFRFPKGHVPANKGLRRPGWSPGRMAETQFRKGQRSGIAVRLYQPIGAERISKDGYLQRKVNDDLPLQAARTIAEVGRVIVDTAKVEVQFLNVIGGSGSGFIPTVDAPAPAKPKLVEGGRR